MRASFTGVIVFVVACASGVEGTSGLRGQPPDGAATPDPPAAASDDERMEISVGAQICVRRGGSVACRGGEQGSPGRFEPVAGIEDAIAVNAGLYATCVVHRDGGVSCWGKIGQVESPTPVRVQGISDAVSVSPGQVQACALRRGGSVSCWGFDQRPWRAAALGLDRVAEIAMGAQHGCARRDDGSVWCWGGNWLGGLGPRSGGPSRDPFAIEGVADAISIDAERARTCALARSGRVTCWGDRAPEPFTVDGGATIGVGAFHVCVRKSDGTVRCTGDTEHGALGDGRAVVRGGSVDVPGLAGATTLSVLGATSCAMSGRGPVCWGVQPERQGMSPGFRPWPTPLSGLDGIAARDGLTLPLESIPAGELPARHAGGPASLRVRGAGVHGAARFAAFVRRGNVLVAADAGAPIEVTLGPGTAQQALETVARAAGLSVERWGSLTVVASAERLAAARAVKAPALRGRRRIDLDFERASAGQLMELLADVEDWELAGLRLPGQITIVARNAATAEVAQAVLRLAAARVEVRGRQLTIAEGALPPPSADDAPAPACDSVGTTLLPCAPPYRFRVGGVAVEAGHAHALLIAGAESRDVREGDFVGQAERFLALLPDGFAVALTWRVQAIAGDDVVLALDNPADPDRRFVRRLRLGDPEAGPEVLRAF